MTEHFRIHGDNVVECERIIGLLRAKITGAEIHSELTAPSTITYHVSFQRHGKGIHWQLDLLPGFNKAGKKRWEKDIFEVLRANGGMLNETPDTIITKVEDGNETVLCAIEFCSALQAGNQAWQRSGRAYSSGIAKCPYLYVTELGNYELEPETRKRKNERIQNPIVPFSYLSFSKMQDTTCLIVYLRAPSFTKEAGSKFEHFDETNFGDTELQNFLFNRMCGESTQAEEDCMKRKAMNIMKFLSDIQRGKNHLQADDWQAIADQGYDLVAYSLQKRPFPFQKTIASKSLHGGMREFRALVEKLSVGCGSNDLPFGIIPKENRKALSCGLQNIYPQYDEVVLKQLAADDKALILCMMKCFKPKGDDARPDRGVVAMATMATKNVDIMSYIYGPIFMQVESSLDRNQEKLSRGNGLWNAILLLSDFVAVDCPVLDTKTLKQQIYNTRDIKFSYQGNLPAGKLEMETFSSHPLGFHEDDVDAGIHDLFTHQLPGVFEGLCNPPGGDWSGLSIMDGDVEKRWLSLPRVSKDKKGKRPDHVYEFFEVADKPVLLIIESKEFSSDLEPHVGTGLTNYIHYLMGFAPSAEKHGDAWTTATTNVDENQFLFVSAAAYLAKAAKDDSAVYQHSACEMLFKMTPADKGWKIEISTRTELAARLKAHLIRRSQDNSFYQFK